MNVLAIAHKASERFMHKGRGLKGVPGALVGHFCLGKPAKVVVHEFEKPAGFAGRRVAPGGQDSGDLAAGVARIVFTVDSWPDRHAQ